MANPRDASVDEMVMGAIKGNDTQQLLNLIHSENMRKISLKVLREMQFKLGVETANALSMASVCTRSNSLVTYYINIRERQSSKGKIKKFAAMFRRQGNA